uniref:CCHC-type domain-containing protein n=1 Tax=Globodera rostochiensis TaxID=31243 RepID=A0A914HLD4_GLORO
MEQLNGLFGKLQSVWIDRYECLRAMKQEDEEFSTFVNRHKRLLRDFDFKQLKEEQFNSLMFLIALKSPSEAALRSRILAKLAADGDQIKYDKVVNDLKMYLSTIAEAKALEQPGATKNLFAVSTKTQKRKNSENSSRGSESQRSQAYRKCWRCGNDHPPAKCRHVTTVCRKCNKTGHMERMCASHQAWLKKNGTNEMKAANTVRLGGISLVKKDDQQRRRIEIPTLVNGKEVKFLMDSGAEVTVLNEETHCLIGKPHLRYCSERAQYPDGSTRPVLGKGSATFSIGERTQKGQFYVCPKGSMNLMGSDLLDAFGILQGTDVLAHHHSALPWKAGYVTNRRVVMYTVKFLDGYSGRFFVNQLRSPGAKDVENGNLSRDEVGLRKAPSLDNEERSMNEDEPVLRDRLERDRTPFTV